MRYANLQGLQPDLAYWDGVSRDYFNLLQQMDSYLSTRYMYEPDQVSSSRLSGYISGGGRYEIFGRNLDSYDNYSVQITGINASTPEFNMTMQGDLRVDGWGYPYGGVSSVNANYRGNRLEADGNMQLDGANFLYYSYNTVEKVWLVNGAYLETHTNQYGDLVRVMAQHEGHQLVAEGVWQEPIYSVYQLAEKATTLSGTPVVVSEALDADVNDMVLELYTAFFNRFPEHDGLDYWSQRVKTALENGQDAEAVRQQVADEFWDAALQFDELTGYSENTSSRDFVAQVYSNVLARPDAVETDQDGINYWVNRLDSGEFRNRGELVVTLTDEAWAFIQADPTNPVSVKVNRFFEDRAIIGEFFAGEGISAGLSNEQAYQLGVDVMQRLSSIDPAISNDRALEVIEYIQSQYGDVVMV